MRTAPDGGTVFIGAYERENFGDILFGHVTSVWSSTSEENRFGVAFPGLDGPTSEYQLERYSDIIDRGANCDVWVVGGEVGGATLLKAYAMSAPAVEFERFSRANRTERRRIVSMASGMPWHTSAYMPYLAGHRGRYVINSVGLYSIGGLRGREFVTAFRALRQASYISVRESYSHRLLKAIGVRHEMAPDVVHVIGSTDLVKARESGHTALVQLREETLRAVTPARLAKVLVNSRHLRPYEIRLFRAGSARMHDSLDLYKRVQEESRRLDRGRIVTISTARSSIDKAREIAEASLWIGTSLHGNIVSSAFGVPRVAIANVKVARYCATWGEPMPFNVDVEDLDAAVEMAFSQGCREAGKRYSNRMCQAAGSNLVKAQKS